MAHPCSPAPYIKEDPDHFHPGFHTDFGMSHPFGNGQQQQYAINPNDLAMGSSFILNNQYGSNNMSSSFLGNSNIADDELRDLVEATDTNAHHVGFQNLGDGHPDQQHHQDYFRGQLANASAMHNQSTVHMCSSTPDGAPIQSPFLNNGFSYETFPSHRVGSLSNGSLALNAVQPSRMPIDRHLSDSRSPMTPKTPAMLGLHLHTPDSGSFPVAQPVHATHLAHGHTKSVPGHWDNTPNSGGSWIDSPIVSPQQAGVHQVQIADVISSGKHASLPTKVDNHAPAFQSQEAKRRRRRESHNMVERRRRDNINERIQDLSKLVPQHRLEDDKLRKHIHNNGPMSPSMPTTAGISPPQATSLLAGPNGRRATGSIATGFTLDEKDKGPNKGDILNGSVSWTRDLMWMLYLKLGQEEQLCEQIRALGGDATLDYTENEARMKTELIDAVEKNNWDSFHYSRGPGSGLRVPRHTNITGEPLQNPISPQSLSPTVQPGSSSTISGGAGQPGVPGVPGVWASQQPTFKEEDEFGMEL